jgi:hypothetical protein
VKGEDLVSPFEERFGPHHRAVSTVARADGHKALHPPRAVTRLPTTLFPNEQRRLQSVEPVH